MSVTVKASKNGFKVEINTRGPNGERIRDRKWLSIRSKSAAERWGQDRERDLLQHGRPQAKKEVPTLQDFSSRFLDDHARANRQKPSAIAAQETILRVHLVRLLGTKRLDAICSQDVQWLKGRLQDRAPKTVNNILAVLSSMLKRAIEWDVIDRMPCAIKLLPVPLPPPKFHDFDDFERLVRTAKAVDDESFLIVLLGGEAGLRCGETMALQWRDVDLRNGKICVRESIWKGQTTIPKGGRIRYVDLTDRLADALKGHRSLRSKYVLSTPDGAPLSQRVVQGFALRAAREARLQHKGVHVLRHTFCSHLAMKGAHAIEIQRLAGHRSLSTTERYMHLSPSAGGRAISLLNPPKTHGNIVATPDDAAENANVC